MNRETPVIVPPVPTPETSTSIAPSVSSQISGPVVVSWIPGLAGLSNCCGRKKRPGSLFAISSAFATAPGIPFGPSVSTSFAPSIASTLRRSMLIVSGITSVIAYPRVAATNASAIPVLPLVGSMISFPGLSTPRFSASHTIAAPMRHFTEYDGFRPSTFPSTVPPTPFAIRFSRTSGVRPIESALSLNQLATIPFLSRFPVRTHT